MPEREMGGGPGPGGMQGGGKAKDFWKAIQELFFYGKAFLPLCLLAMLFSILATVLNILGPSLLKNIVDYMRIGVMGGILNADLVSRIAFRLLFYYLLSFLLGSFQGMLMAYITQRITLSLRSDLSRKLHRLPLLYYDRHSTGDILSRVTNDVDLIGQAMNQSLGMAISTVFTFLGTLVMMFHTSWILAIVAILSTFLGMGGMRFLISRSQSYFIGQQKMLGALNGYVEECYTGHSILKAYGGEGAALECFSAQNHRLYDRNWKSQFLAGLMEPMMSLVGSFSYVLICVLGVILVLQDRISFGAIVAFMIYIRMFAQPLTQFAEVSAMFQSVAAASERVFQFLREREMPESPKGKELAHISRERLRGQVDFQNVSFGYRPDKPVLKDFSISVPPGQKLAIVGPTGAGKTTIVNLLMRFYDPQAGEILIDGLPIRNMAREDVHSLFGMVLQDPWIFSASILENLLMTDGEEVAVGKAETAGETRLLSAGVEKHSFSAADRRKAEAACEAVGLHHYIMTLPEGYDTLLGEAVALSQGQRQLLSIARAMVQDAPMLILDEATSAVDSLTERRVQEAMDKLMRGRTSFIIAHRLSTIVHAGQILVLRDGEIIERGCHQELLQQGGFYAELYRSGFSEAP